MQALKISRALMTPAMAGLFVGILLLWVMNNAVLAESSPRNEGLSSLTWEQWENSLT